MRQIVLIVAASVFLSACSASPSVVPVTAAVPPTPMVADASTATSAPPTPVALDAYAISQDLAHPADLPKSSLGNFVWSSNQRFAAWVIAADAGGLFPDVRASAVPFGVGAIRAFTDADLEAGKPLGLLPAMFRILDPEYKDASLRPWVVAAAWQVDFRGENAYLVLMKYANTDGTHGFWAYIFEPLVSQARNGSLDWQLAEYFPGSSGETYLSAAYLFHSDYANGCYRFFEASGQTESQLCNWYYEDFDVSFPIGIVTEWAASGILRNEAEVDGKLVPLIPVTPASPAIEF